MIRTRAQKDPLKVVRQLDAFSKIPEEYQASASKTGGLLSLLSRILIVYLVYNEVNYYMDSKMVFKFEPDIEMDSKLRLHIDVTIASPCKSIGADILDSTNQNVFSFGILQEEDTWWELDYDQQAVFDYIENINTYMREQYHSIIDILYKQNHRYQWDLPPRKTKLNRPYDSCRIHGALTLNKVAGNLHITRGKSLHFGQGHIHINSMFDMTPSNFSHRIDRFSFGDGEPGIVHPLEGTKVLLQESATMAQYFIEVVPTDVRTSFSNVKTFQYSAKENRRPIDHNKGSHGIPGLYFKYDMSAMKVIVTQDREHIFKFIVRICAVISGIVVISGMLINVIQAIVAYLDPNQYEQFDAKPKSCGMNAASVNSIVTETAPAVVTVKNTNLLFTTDVEPKPICDITVTKQ